MGRQAHHLWRRISRCILRHRLAVVRGTRLVLLPDLPRQGCAQGVCVVYALRVLLMCARMCVGLRVCAVCGHDRILR